MIDKKLELSKSIVDYLPIICEYFIKYYGDNFRQIITERLKNCTYIGYNPEDVIKSHLRCVYKDKTNELVEKFFLENGLENNDLNREKYFGFYIDLLNVTNINLNKIFKCMEADNYINNNNLVYYLSKFSGNDDLEFGSEEFYNLVSDLKKIKSSFDKMLQEFDEVKEKYAKYQQYVDSCENLKNKLKDKYKLCYLKGISEYLDEHDKKMVEIAINNNKSVSLWDLNCCGVLCSFSYDAPALIDSFSRESEEKLKDENVRDYVKRSIYEDRIKYFNKLGIYLGNDYENYIRDERCLELMPDVVMVDKIIKIRKDLSNQEKFEYVTSTSEYQLHLKEIEALNLIDKNFAYNCEGILSNLTCVNPNIRMKDGKIQLYCLLLFSGRNLPDFFDKNVMHELNHLIEIELIKADNEFYIVRSGWDILNCKINDESVSDEKRNFEYFNEIINELLCQEITKMLHDAGIYLFDDEDTSRTKGGTTYERGKFLVVEFFEEFKEFIKYSRITGDMDSLYKIVGQDNLIELNELVNDFFEYFSEFKFYALCDELGEKLDTDNVRFYNKCIERKNIILSKMREKKLESEESNSLVK